jgi:Flp pilus assembly protein TadG
MTGPRHRDAARARSARGQASVELVALLPLLLVVALAVFCVVAAHGADEQAGAAAEAAAVALIQGGDPRAAALAALPRHADAAVAVDGGAVHVHVRPRLPLPVPGLPERLAGDARAVAGAAAP